MRMMDKESADSAYKMAYAAAKAKVQEAVEAQRSTSNNKLGYHIESRIAYYMARMVSSQKNVEFIKSNYDELKDIYSIWICMDTQDGEDSIIELGIQPKLLYLIDRHLWRDYTGQLC